MTYRQLVLLVVIAFAVAIIAARLTPVRAGECQVLTASWYGKESGNRTADGTHFTGRELLVAHRTLPFGTKLRLTYKGRSVTVPVRDRGPFIAGRDLDVSEAVAERLRMKGAGVVRLCMERLS